MAMAMPQDMAHAIVAFKRNNHPTMAAIHELLLPKNPQTTLKPDPHTIRYTLTMNTQDTTHKPCVFVYERSE